MGWLVHVVQWVEWQTDIASTGESTTHALHCHTPVLASETGVFKTSKYSETTHRKKWLPDIH